MDDFIKKVIEICTVEDLMKGYVYDDCHRVYTCIFCGEIYEEDLIYKYNEQLCTAKKAVEAHILEEHQSPFDFLLSLGKRHTGLTERQEEIFKILYDERDNQVIAEQMETTPATVRSYRFKIREKLRQAKVYMAITYLIEQENYNENLYSKNVSDVAFNEKQKSIQENTNEIKSDNDLEELLNEKIKGTDLNVMNLFVDKKGPDME